MIRQLSWEELDLFGNALNLMDEDNDVYSLAQECGDGLPLMIMHRSEKHHAQPLALARLFALVARMPGYSVAGYCRSRMPGRLVQRSEKALDELGWDVHLLTSGCPRDLGWFAPAFRVGQFMPGTTQAERRNRLDEVARELFQGTTWAEVIQPGRARG